MPSVGHQAPPFFKRGLPASARLTIYLALSLGLLVGDMRLRYLDTLRQGIAVLTYPVQIAAATPAEFVRNASNYFSGLLTLQRENQRLRESQLKDAQDLLSTRQLLGENARLRGLLSMRERLKVSATAAEILFTARDPFSRKVILDKGGNRGIESGLAVVDEKGVIGQVTRVFPLHSEVTLLSDKNQAIPVMIERSGLRAVMFGTGSGYMELKYLAANADVQLGDRIITSGLDGVFVPGLPVAVVVKAQRDSGESFARILCKPVGGVENSGAVLVLGRAEGVLPRPAEDSEDPKRAIFGRIHRSKLPPASVPAETSAPQAQSTPAASVQPAARPLAP